MRTVCLCAALCNLFLLSVTAHAAPPVKAAAPPTSAGKPKQPKPHPNKPVQKKLFNDTGAEDTGNALNLPPRQKLITVRATVRDSAGKPPLSAVMEVEDKHGWPAGSPNLAALVSSNGKLDNQYLQSPAHYFVTVSAQGCFTSAPQEISGLHDANLTFVLKRRPKTSRPKHRSY